MKEYKAIEQLRIKCDKCGEYLHNKDNTVFKGDCEDKQYDGQYDQCCNVLKEQGWDIIKGGCDAYDKHICKQCSNMLHKHNRRLSWEEAKRTIESMNELGYEPCSVDKNEYGYIIHFKLKTN